MDNDAMTKKPPVDRPWTEDFYDLISAPKIPPRWIIDGILPTGLVVLGGYAKLSQKSTFALTLAARVAGLTINCPEHIQERRTDDGRVLFFSAEAEAGDLRSTYEDRLGGSGPILTDHVGGLLVARNPMSFRLDAPACIARLTTWYDARQPALVIIDPLRAFHGLDERDEAGIERLLRRHQQWARQANSTIVIVHHVRKPPPAESGLGARRPPALLTPDDLRGSGALWALADGAIMLTPIDANVATKMTTIHVGGWYKRGRTEHWKWQVPT